MDENGAPIEVEIDESKYFHRKYHHGHYREGHWVFGWCERKTGKCFLIEVPDRSAPTLQAEILRHILPGSHFISDGWAAYANIPGMLNNSMLCVYTWLHILRTYGTKPCCEDIAY